MSKRKLQTAKRAAYFSRGNGLYLRADQSTAHDWSAFCETEAAAELERGKERLAATIAKVDPYAHITLPRYRDWSPTSLDTIGLGLEDQQDWFVAPCSHTRDSGILDQANWQAQETILKEVSNDKPADYESEPTDIHRFGHWGPGWIEIVLVNPDFPAHVQAAQDIADGLSNYPIVNESTYSEMEWEKCEALWTQASADERRAWIRRVSPEMSHRDVDKYRKRKTIPHEVRPDCGWADLMGVHG